MDDIIIVDNALSRHVFNRVTTTVHAEDFPWWYMQNTAYRHKDHDSTSYSTNQFSDQFSFANLVYALNIANGSIIAKSNAFDMFDLVFRDLIDKAIPDLHIKNLWRIRLGMITKSNEVLPHSPHVDMHQHHMSALFYLTTCDAPTIFYNEKFDINYTNSMAYADNIIKNNFSIKKKVDCVANRFVVFDGLQYHSSTTPTNVDRRIAVNFNFTI